MLHKRVTSHIFISLKNIWLRSYSSVIKWERESASWKWCSERVPWWCMCCCLGCTDLNGSLASSKIISSNLTWIANETKERKRSCKGKASVYSSLNRMCFCLNLFVCVCVYFSPCVFWQYYISNNRSTDIKIPTKRHFIIQNMHRMQRLITLAISFLLLVLLHLLCSSFFLLCVSVLFVAGS